MPQVGLAIAGALGVTSTLGVAAIQLGTSLLLSTAAQALMPKPDVQSIRGHQTTTRQPIAPREIVYGRTRKGGTIVFLETRNNSSPDVPNSVMDMVIVLASHECEKIGKVYFDGRLAFDEGNVNPESWLYNDSGNAVAFCQRRTGKANQQAITSLISDTNGRWSSSHTLSGCAYIYLRLYFNPDKFPSGIPNVTADITGKNDIYDPRTGTRGYSENAALCLADYMSLDPFGLGAQIGAEDGINTNALIEAANVCWETVNEKDGSTDRRYRCNGVVTLDQSPKTIIEAILTAMAGQVVWQNGQWHIYAGAYRTPTLSFTADDFAGGIQLQTRISKRENFNAVRGKFISNKNNWQPDDFPAYKSATYLAEDNNERAWDDINLPFTISPYAAQRLAKIHLERKRRQQRIVVRGKLPMWEATVGSVINLTYPRYGFTNKPFEVRGVTLAIQDGALVPELVLQETSPLVYDHTASEFEIYEAAPTTNLPSAFDIDPPTGLTATESLYTTLNGAGVKAKVRLSWTAPTTYVDQYQVEASDDGGTTWQVLGRTTNTFFDALDWTPGAWQFRVKSVFQVVSSAYTTITQAIYGLSSNPAGITGLKIQKAGGTAILKWTLHPDLDVRIGGNILIRHSTATVPAWTSSRSYASTGGSATDAAVPLLSGTYLVRAQDSSGNLGPVATVDTDNAEVVAYANLTTLTEDTAFTGTKTDCGAVGGTLILSGTGNVSTWALVSGIAKVSAAGGYTDQGTYEFASGMDFGTVKTVRLSADVEMTIDSTSDLISERLGNVSTWQQISSGRGDEVDVVVEARTTPDDPAGSPTWGPWTRVDRSDVTARGVEARAILTSDDATYTPVVSRLRLSADEAA